MLEAVGLWNIGEESSRPGIELAKEICAVGSRAGGLGLSKPFRCWAWNCKI